MELNNEQKQGFFKKRELNLFDVVCDEYIAQIEDNYERISFARELKSLIEKSPEKVLEALDAEIGRAESACLNNDICPECGESLDVESEEESRGEYWGSSSYERMSYSVCASCGYSTR